MSKVDLVCGGFSGSFAGVNGAKTIQVSTLEMVRAIATVGMQSSSGVSDWVIRVSRILSAIAATLYLEERQGDLCLRPDFDNIDASEKGYLGYWLGAGFAKIVASVVLDVPCLQNVDNLIKQGTVRTDPQSRRRGDFVGLSSRGEWHAIEAKGRSQSRTFKGTHSLVRSAKGQSVKILTAAGAPPATNSACLTALLTAPISVLLYDPPADDSEVLFTTANDFYRRYYECVIEIIRFFGFREEKYGGRSFQVSIIPFPITLDRLDCEWKLGLLAEIFDSPEHAGNFVGKLDLQKYDFIGLDGILLEPSRNWFNTNLTKEL